MWRIIHDLGIVCKRPKLELEKGDDYERKRRTRYRRVQEDILCSFYLKKILLGFEDETWLHLQPIYNKNIHEKKRRTAKDTSQRI